MFFGGIARAKLRLRLFLRAAVFALQNFASLVFLRSPAPRSVALLLRCAGALSYRSGCTAASQRFAVSKLMHSAPPAHPRRVSYRSVSHSCGAYSVNGTRSSRLLQRFAARLVVHWAVGSLFPPLGGASPLPHKSWSENFITLNAAVSKFPRRPRRPCARCPSCKRRRRYMRR